MSGNVWEWCSDKYGDDYSKSSSKDNTSRSYIGPYRVYRGGAWYINSKACASDSRRLHSPTLETSGLGFRLAL